tara:strand:- start:13692 stop:14597 length:906 start_codon:yes stop_codon:yes gene_type:complete
MEWQLHKKKLVVVGTSHVEEKHAQSDASDRDNTHFFKNGRTVNKLKYYIDWGKQKTWTHALSDKIGYDDFNRGLSGYGKDTYPLRVLSIVNDLKPNLLLLEIPSYSRVDIALEVFPELAHQHVYTDKHWNDKQYLKKYLYHLSHAEAGLDPKSFEKFNNLQVTKSAELDPKTIKEMTKIELVRNKQYYTDFIFAQVVLISGYLKNNNIDHAWFNFNFAFDRSDIQEVDSFEFDTALFRRYNIEYVNEIINNQSLCEYAINNYKKHPEVGFLADGMHLNSNYWKMLVDDVFVPYLNKTGKGK